MALVFAQFKNNGRPVNPFRRIFVFPSFLKEVLNHYLNLLADVVWMQANPAHQPLEGFAALDLLVIPLITVVRQLEGQLVRGVVLQNVENEAFLDGLAHRIDVEGRRQVVRASWLIRLGFASE